jgi:hypothetical protein
VVNLPKVGDWIKIQWPAQGAYPPRWGPALAPGRVCMVNLIDTFDADLPIRVHVPSSGDDAWLKRTEWVPATPEEIANALLATGTGGQLLL